jgi:hypothetical protein
MRSGALVSPQSRDPSRRAAQRRNLRPAPPAPLGHTRTLKSGGRATAKTLPVAETAAEIRDALAAAAPVRDDAGELPVADEPVVELAALALCRVRRVSAWLDAFGFMDERTGDVRPAVRYLEEATRTADRLLGSLGMTPTSRAKLGLDLVRQIDLATAMSEPDPVLRCQLLREAGVAVDEDGER